MFTVISQQISRLSRINELPQNCHEKFVAFSQQFHGEEIPIVFHGIFTVLCRREIAVNYLFHGKMDFQGIFRVKLFIVWNP